MSEEDKAKQDVIESVFYDDDYGYGSKTNALRSARQMNRDIIMGDTHKFIEFHIETK